MYVREALRIDDDPLKLEAQLEENCYLHTAVKPVAISSTKDRSAISVGDFSSNASMLAAITAGAMLKEIKNTQYI